MGGQQETRWMTVGEAVSELGLSEVWVRRLVSEGRLAIRRDGRRVYLASGDVRRYGASRRAGGTAMREGAHPARRLPAGRRIPAPPVAVLLRARDVYQKVEVRDLVYRGASQLVGDALEGRPSALGVGEAVAVLLFSWNSARYRYNRADTTHVDRLDGLIRGHLARLSDYRARRLASLRPGDGGDIADMFSSFEGLLGPVGAAKALHMLAPTFFPIWDRKIAVGYGCGLGRAGTNAARYGEFMSVSAEQCRELEGQPGCPVDLVKALDEWNYVRLTRGDSGLVRTGA